MATHITRVPLFVHDDDTFRAFISGTMQAIEAVGWINTNASGTVNSGTTTWRPSTQINDYVIYAAPDSFQSTSPVFIQLRFSRNNTFHPISNVQLLANIASSVDADGLLTNATIQRDILNVTTAIKSGSTAILIAAGGDGYLNLCLNPGENNVFGYVICVNRTNDITGSITGNGVVLLGIGTNTTRSWFGAIRYNPFGLPATIFEPNANNNVPFYFPDDSTTDISPPPWISSLNIPVTMLNVGITDLIPSFNVLYVKRLGSDPQFDIQPITVFNKTITYINIGAAFSLNAVATNFEGSLLFRWE